MQIQEITARHILTRSKLPGLDYCVNPYVGCQHACVYCYACFMKRFTNHAEPWGTFVDVKINAAEAFADDFRKVKMGEGAFFGSVTDAYQPCEAKYKLTRSILKIVARDTLRQFSVSILTKSDLVLRDIDLLKKISDVSVGFSISMPNEKARRLFEPCGVPMKQRFDALEILREEGIGTYSFIGPILPGITEIASIFASLEGNVDYVYGETLNTHCGNMPQVFRAVSSYDRSLRSEFERNLKSDEYWDGVTEEFHELAAKHGIEVAGFFRH